MHQVIRVPHFGCRIPNEIPPADLHPVQLRCQRADFRRPCRILTGYSFPQGSNGTFRIANAGFQGGSFCRLGFIRFNARCLFLSNTAFCCGHTRRKGVPRHCFGIIPLRPRGFFRFQRSSSVLLCCGYGFDLLCLLGIDLLYLRNLVSNFAGFCSQIRSSFISRRLNCSRPFPCLSLYRIRTVRCFIGDFPRRLFDSCGLHGSSRFRACGGHVVIQGFD